MDINRKTAYNTLFEIEKSGAYSNIILNQEIKEINPDSPAFVRELVYGVLENKIYIDYILNQLIPKGLKGVKKQDLTLLRMGIYQIEFMHSVPEYAAVNESVKMAKKLCRGRDGFINGVLRGYGKKKDKIHLPDKTNMIEYLSVKYSYDQWIVKMWAETYGIKHTEDILRAGNDTPKLSLRVNRLKGSRGDLITSLTDMGFSCEFSTNSENIIYATGSNILLSEPFKAGRFSVQDEASVMAIECLNPAPGSTVIDTCAAPGGKSLAMAELMDDSGKIISLDIYKHKLQLLEKEAERLGLHIIDTRENDGTVFNVNFENLADYVLADVPCSGLGVIRKKPEIKYKVLSDNGNELSEKQYEILEISSRYVKEGGVLMYSTCTINRIENEMVTGRFLAAHKEYELLIERQLMPDTDKTDGFYFCKMRKLG